MKQIKNLELVKGVQLVAEKDDEGIFQLSINLGKKVVQLRRESVAELVNWLSQEVLQEVLRDIPESNFVAVVEKRTAQGLTSNGPVVLQPGTKIGPMPLEDRIASVSSTPNIRDLSGTAKLITAKDEFQVHNLSRELGKAVEAFSPEHVFDGGNNK